jgi:hypothetical protein
MCMHDGKRLVGVLAKRLTGRPEPHEQGDQGRELVGLLPCATAGRPRPCALHIYGPAPGAPDNDEAQ